jgi:phosphate transport system substrate-binding protein
LITRRKPDVKLLRHGSIACIALTGMLALAACGSDNTTTAGAGGGSIPDCAEGQLNAEGSSAQNTAMETWLKNYSSACGATINYTASGSGAGVKQFIAGKVPFAGSDSALKDDERGPADARCATGKAVDVPMVVSPIAVTYNLDGVDSVALSPAALAGIFQGTVKTWNDKAIAATNPGVTLPATSIQVIYRSKDSGTTDNFTKFLDAAAGGAWKLGTGKAWRGTVGQGAPASGDVVAAVKSTAGAISYVDGPDATKNGLSAAALDLGSGPVEISDESVGKAVAAAGKKVDGNDITLSLNYGLKEAGAYPLVLVTYEITCEKGLDAAQATLVKSFLSYTASNDGQTAAAELGYSKLPAELQAEVQKAVSAIS